MNHREKIVEQDLSKLKISVLWNTIEGVKSHNIKKISGKGLVSVPTIKNFLKFSFKKKTCIQNTKNCQHSIRTQSNFKTISKRFEQILTKDKWITNPWKDA